MQNARPETGSSKIPLDIILACGALAVLFLSMAISPDHLPAIQLCMFRHWTGLPCPGCGITRAFCAIGHGELRAAWDYNPLSLPFYAAAIGLLFLPLIRWKLPDLWNRLNIFFWLARGAVLLVIAMCMFGIARIFELLHSR
ncbi:MAG: DUF2752 domain-containing protein [bacterium]